MRVAIDSSVLVGLINPKDLWRSQALALHERLIRSQFELFYFDCVVSESVSVVARRLHEKGSSSTEIITMLERLEAQAPDETITWILPDVPRLYPEVIELIRDSAGALNFNDALIGLACRERQIPAIASFDADFDRLDWLQRLAAPADVSSP